MKKKFNEYKNFDLAEINREVLKKWKTGDTFHKSISNRSDASKFIFYEGPPSANGKPGIHHVISRTIKDIICRFKTLDGYRVERKAGWDTHGLPIELAVEQMLHITKEDIGKKISIEDFNKACKKEVMKYTREWEELTDIMGYWIDMDDPYITFDNRYVETLWWLLKKMYQKDLLYKGYTIQPYSPAAGTGLSTHELNQPGCYRDVKDTTCVAMFKVIKNDHSDFLFNKTGIPVYILAWTTTPWTLPSNTALAVGSSIRYVNLRTFNPYSGKPVNVILAKDLLPVYFPVNNEKLTIESYNPGDKELPFSIDAEFSGKDLRGILYEQLFDWVNPGENAFQVFTADFVTTEDGTGVVHIAPTFGADDYQLSREHNIPPLLVKDKEGNTSPLVDKKGRFIRIGDISPSFLQSNVNVEKYNAFAGRYVKNDYDESIPKDTLSLDVDLAVHLKHEEKVFRIEKHVHNYPHCWRTDKPILYYPLDSWFIRTTAMKDRLIKLNNTINWKPESTGSGRFGKWLENLVDWNLSRSRFWGTPLPIWVSEDKKDNKCIGSAAELKTEIERSVKAGFMKENPLEKFVADDFSDDNYNRFDLHRPFVDEIILVSDSGEKMYREPDLIDVWFDSGAMPYAQLHYPFENKNNFKSQFPADFIAEGVDQTRGWFFTLHVIAALLFDSVAFKNIISNGLVLDKSGNKMSKRLGNAVDPFTTIDKYGSDPLRWYMMTNSQPWDNLKFDMGGPDEVKRKFFGTLYNTYSFFAMYANIDGFAYREEEIPLKDRPEIDRWILSLLHSLIKEVRKNYEDYEITKAGRLIQDFVTDNLSNWYVRLNRKRYWGGEYDNDKIAAYQTLYTCLETVAVLASPIIPFYTDKLFCDLNEITGNQKVESVHLLDFPEHNDDFINKDLEERMDIAQKVSSMVLGLRRKVNIKVRQPLNRIMIPIQEKGFEKKFETVKSLIQSEVNVKEIEYISDTAGILVKNIKPDFKKLGPRFGNKMKEISSTIAGLTQNDIQQFEVNGKFRIRIGNEHIELLMEDVEIISEDIPGWLVANEGKLTVALDVTISDELRKEGIAREFINRIQNIRKETGFDVTDKIHVKILKHESINDAVMKYSDYIGSQTLAKKIELVDNLNGDSKEIEIDDVIKTSIIITRIA